MKIEVSIGEIFDKLSILEIIKEKKNNEFDEDFIELTKSVYITNDNRSDIKYEINKISKSEIIEEKNYVDYL